MANFMEYNELLLGCGRRISKDIVWNNKPAWNNLTTLDFNPLIECDIRHDLNNPQMPFFESNWFDEIHAYEVLEHCGRQGDWKLFFDQFSEFYRILKPGGVICASVPSPYSGLVWADPSHTRQIHPVTLNFLSQLSYAEPDRCDFRWYYKGDFQRVMLKIDELRMLFILQAVKPARQSNG